MAKEIQARGIAGPVGPNDKVFIRVERYASDGTKMSVENHPCRFEHALGPEVSNVREVKVSMLPNGTYRVATDGLQVNAQTLSLDDVQVRTILSTLNIRIVKE